MAKKLKYRLVTLLKGYSTEQHLSNEGRKLGDARKQLDEEVRKKEV